MTWGCPDVPYGGTWGVFHVLEATPCPIWGRQEGPPCPGDALMSHMGAHGGSSKTWGCPDVPYGDTGGVFHVLGAAPCPIWGHQEGLPCPGGNPMSHMGTPGGSSVSWGCPDVPYGNTGRVSHVLGATSYRDREGHMGGPPCLRNIPTPHMGAHGGSSMPQGPPDVPTSHMGYMGGPPCLRDPLMSPHPIWGHMGGPPCLRDPLMSPRPIWGTRGVLHGLTPTSHWDNAELWGRADPRTSGPIGRQRPPAPNKLLADCFTFVTQKGDILGSIRSPPRRPAAPPPPFSLSAHAHP